MACPKPFNLLLLLLQLQLMAMAVNSLLPSVATFTDHTPASPECQPDQASALLRLRRSFSATNHSTVAFRSWKTGTDCCRWEGVRCRGATGHVSSLDLGDRGLESRNLDLSLFELTSLRYLNLAGNDFRMSEIPSTGFERLTKLTQLNLSATNFSGQVPRSIGRLTSLVSLDLSFRFRPSTGPFHVNIKFHADITRQGQLTLPNLTAILANMGGLRELHLGFVDLSNQGGGWCTALASLVQGGHWPRCMAVLRLRVTRHDARLFGRQCPVAASCLTERTVPLKLIQDGEAGPDGEPHDINNNCMLEVLDFSGGWR